MELSRDRKSCHRSRHVDRRFFKVRELVAAGNITVEHVPTEKNRADFLTKPLDDETFLRHRVTTMNSRVDEVTPSSGQRGGCWRQGGDPEPVVAGGEGSESPAGGAYARRA